MSKPYLTSGDSYTYVCKHCKTEIEAVLVRTNKRTVCGDCSRGEYDKTVRDARLHDGACPSCGESSENAFERVWVTGRRKKRCIACNIFNSEKQAEWRARHPEQAAQKVRDYAHVYPEKYPERVRKFAIASRGAARAAYARLSPEEKKARTVTARINHAKRIAAMSPEEYKAHRYKRNTRQKERLSKRTPEQKARAAKTRKEARAAKLAELKKDPEAYAKYNEERRANSLKWWDSVREDPEKYEARKKGKREAYKKRQAALKANDPEGYKELLRKNRTRDTALRQKKRDALQKSTEAARVSEGVGGEGVE